MTENLKVNIKTDQANVEFILTFDSNFPPDRNMRLLLERDHACEPEIVHLMTRVLKPGDVCVDGGANVGYFTCLMSQLVGKTGLVYAVEPTPINIAKIEQNLANNKTTNVRLVKTALYSEATELTLHMGFDTGSNSITPHPDAVGNMKLVSTTIDAMLDSQVPKLIKLDIEGAELKALKGADNTLYRYPYVTCELNHEALARCGATELFLRDFMVFCGYQTWILNTDGSLPRLVPHDSHIISSRPNLMVLFATEEMVAKAWPDVEVG